MLSPANKCLKKNVVQLLMPLISPVLNKYCCLNIFSMQRRDECLVSLCALWFVFFSGLYIYAVFYIDVGGGRRNYRAQRGKCWMQKILQTAVVR